MLLVSVASSALLAQAPSNEKPRLRFEADCHACAGYLRTTATRFIWKSAFSLCDVQYRVLNHNKENGEWTLELYPNSTSAQQHCNFRIVSIRPLDTDQNVPDGIRYVAGYNSLNDFHANPPRDSLGCTMQ
jgi:hypothetical protein